MSQKIVSYPIGSLYAIYGNIYHQYTPNVSIYTVHGSYGYCITGFDQIEHMGSMCAMVPWSDCTRPGKRANILLWKDPPFLMAG